MEIKLTEDIQAYHRAYYEKHKEKAKQRTKDWYATNKERAATYHKKHAIEKGEILKKKKREYYAKNREVIRKKQNEANATNPKLAYERVIKWRKSNPEKYKTLYTRGMNQRRALKLGSQIGEVNYELIKKESNMICGICLLPIDGKYEYDHIIPLSKGGPHITENHQLTHPSCNRKKSDKIIK